MIGFRKQRRVDHIEKRSHHQQFSFTDKKDNSKKQKMLFFKNLFVFWVFLCFLGIMLMVNSIWKKPKSNVIWLTKHSENEEKS